MLETRSSTETQPVVIVGLYGSRDPDSPDRCLDELESLVEAAGGRVAHRAFQRAPFVCEGTGRADRPASPGTFIGRGKAETVAELARASAARQVIVDNELSPAQIRELEKVTGCQVIDRSELILDIFASRAQTREAKLQVELAQLEYTAPRLRGMWTHLERQAASGRSPGIGTRGPGEKQIEIDRRIVSKRIARLREQLERIHGRKQREVSGRSERQFCVGLVGYTNAGKSTLMNALTSAGTYVEDQLFATLDTKTRRWELSPGTDVALSDTVGFVSDLPPQLVASFRSTLEETLSADLLLHVIDASHPQALEQVEAVEDVLSELGCDPSRIVRVLNKIDRLGADGDADGGAASAGDGIAILRSNVPDGVPVSAMSGEGLPALKQVVSDRRRGNWIAVRVRAPLSDGRVQAFARAVGQIDDERWEESGWRADIRLARAHLSKLRALGPDVVIEDRSH